MVKEFRCIQCGNCCKDTKIKEKQLKKPEFIRKNLINVNKVSLGLFDWEVNNFRKITKDLEIQMLDVKIANLVYDLKNKISIITHYTYNRHPKCAFLDDKNNCLIYSKRPIICRMWPCPYGKFQPKTLRSSSKVCSAEIPIDQLHEEIKMKQKINTNLIDGDIKNNLIQRYNQNYFYRYLFDEINEFIMIFIEEQTKKNNIKPAKNGYNLEFLRRKIKNSPKIDFSDFYFNTTGERIQKSIYLLGKEKEIIKYIE